MRRAEFVHHAVLAAIQARGFYQANQRVDLVEEAQKVADAVHAREPFDREPEDDTTWRRALAEALAKMPAPLNPPLWPR